MLLLLNRIIIIACGKNDDRALPEAYPSPSHHDIASDEGDPQHKKSFVSLSDDNETEFKKQRRSAFKLRKRVADNQSQSSPRKHFDVSQENPSKGYF